MDRVVLEEALTAVASKLPRNKKLEMVGEEGFEPSRACYLSCGLLRNPLPCGGFMQASHKS